MNPGMEGRHHRAWGLTRTHGRASDADGRARGTAGRGANRARRRTPSQMMAIFQSPSACQNGSAVTSWPICAA